MAEEQNNNEEANGNGDDKGKSTGYHMGSVDTVISVDEVTRQVADIAEEVTVDQVFMPTFDNSRTLQGLSNTGVTCPPVGPDLLQTYLKFFQSSGVGVK